MLSKEKKEKINPRGLYRHDVIDEKVYGNNKYWCHNWTFYPHFSDDGRVYMYDSYFDDWDSAIEVTDENFDEWEFIFDRDKVVKISRAASLEYDDKDLYFDIATDSWGYSQSNIWLNKNAEPNIDKKIKIEEQKLESAISEVEWRREKLERLKEERKNRGKVSKED